MTGTSFGFLLIKSSDLPLYYFPFSFFFFLFFFHMYDYAVIDSGYREASGLMEDSIWKVLEDLLLMVTSTFELCCRLRV